MDEVPELVVGTWVLRDLYEFTPNTVFETTTERTWGEIFRVAGTVRVSGIAWYRGSTDYPKPASLSLWDSNFGVRLYKNDDPPDSGSVGWQEIDLSGSPLDFTSASTLPMVQAYGGTGTHETYGPESADLRGEVGANVILQSFRQNNSVGDTMPTTPFTGQRAGLDLRVEQIPLNGGTVISDDIATALASYLTTAGTNYAGSPLADIHTVTENTYNQAIDNATAITAVKTDTQSLLDRLTVAWRDTVASNTEGIPGFLTAWDAFYTQFVNITAPAVADLVEAVGTYTGISVFGFLAELIRWANGINAPPQLAEGPDWELVDETDFVNNLLWPVEADLYRVTLSAFDPAGTSEPVGTETRHAYLGKWCPFNVQFSSEWHYFNTENADLYLGSRMPGLGLILYRPGAGHVQAWRRVEAP